MNDKYTFLESIQNQIDALKTQGLYKKERLITTPQRVKISTNKKEVICLCSNNYLGLADNESIAGAAIASLKQGNYGMASVRFICGTQLLHKSLENKLAAFLEMEDAILYASCFDANAGLFETLLSKEDAILSDALNHASIIDGIRLCKAQRYRYQNNDMQDLEQKLQEADFNGVRYKLIATDGVFSMDGAIAKLGKICDLADKYHALVMVDDSHAVGFIGENGKGTHEYCKVMGRVDLLTGTLGKAMGGACGGYTAGKKPLITWLRQRSRPYLFSNTLAPALVAGAMKALDLIENGKDLRNRLIENTNYFRTQIQNLGFEILEGEHPIIPVMLGDAALANTMADRLLEEGIYVVGFSYPVVPIGKARIRIQMNARLRKKEIKTALAAFEKVGKELGII